MVNEEMTEEGTEHRRTIYVLRHLPMATPVDPAARFQQAHRNKITEGQECDLSLDRPAEKKTEKSGITCWVMWIA